MKRSWMPKNIERDNHQYKITRLQFNNIQNIKDKYNRRKIKIFVWSLCAIFKKREKLLILFKSPWNFVNSLSQTKMYLKINLYSFLSWKSWKTSVKYFLHKYIFEAFIYILFMKHFPNAIIDKENVVMRSINKENVVINFWSHQSNIQI